MTVIPQPDVCENIYQGPENVDGEEGNGEGDEADRLQPAPQLKVVLSAPETQPAWNGCQRRDKQEADHVTEQRPLLITRARVPQPLGFRIRQNICVWKEKEEEILSHSRTEKSHYYKSASKQAERWDVRNCFTFNISTVLYPQQLSQWKDKRKEDWCRQGKGHWPLLPLWEAVVGARCWTRCGTARSSWCWKTTATSPGSSCAPCPGCRCSDRGTGDPRCCLLRGRYDIWGRHCDKNTTKSETTFQANRVTALTSYYIYIILHPGLGCSVYLFSSYIQTNSKKLRQYLTTPLTISCLKRRKFILLV